MIGIELLTLGGDRNYILMNDCDGITNMCFLLMTLVLVLILNPLLDFFLVYQADVSIFYTSNLY